MSRIKIGFTEDNMDLIMHFVRLWDCNPSEVLNRLLDEPNHIVEARSEHGYKEEGLACKKRQNS